jgi:ATP phosphoribosyltransferase
LIATRTAVWGKTALGVARLLLDRLVAHSRAKVLCEVRTRFPGCNTDLLAIAKRRFGVVSPFGGPTSSGMLTLHCPPSEVHALANFLRDNGAETVVVADIDYIFARDNPLFAKLEVALKAKA